MISPCSVSISTTILALPFAPLPVVFFLALALCLSRYLTAASLARSPPTLATWGCSSLFLPLSLPTVRQNLAPLYWPVVLAYALAGPYSHRGLGLVKQHYGAARQKR